MSSKAMIIIATFICALGAPAGAAQRDPDREILVLVRQGSVVLPTPRSVVPPLSATYKDSKLRDALANPHAEAIERAFPEAKASDAHHVSRDGRTLLTIDMSNLYRVKVASPADRELLIEQLRLSPNVVFAEPNQRIEMRSLPNDPGFHYQWSLLNIGQAGGEPGKDIGAEQAWNYSTGSPLVRIGIVDLGVDATHPEFGGRVTGHTGSNIHATGVASIAAAAGANGLGMAGVVWNNPIISEVVDISDAASVHDAIVDAVNLGCQVINVSWGMANYFTILGDALAYAYNNHVLVVAAMPEPQRLGEYPNKFQELGVMNVGALTNKAKATTYTTAAPYQDVMAPGGNRSGLEAADIYNAIPVSDFAFGSGTSFAAPHVAGAAGRTRDGPGPSGRRKG